MLFYIRFYSVAIFSPRCSSFSVRSFFFVSAMLLLCSCCCYYNEFYIKSFMCRDVLKVGRRFIVAICRSFWIEYCCCCYYWNNIFVEFFCLDSSFYALRVCSFLVTVFKFDSSIYIYIFIIFLLFASQYFSMTSMAFQPLDYCCCSRVAPFKVPSLELFLQADKMSLCSSWTTIRTSNNSAPIFECVQ